jgi:hypothetical protein
MLMKCFPPTGSHTPPRPSGTAMKLIAIPIALCASIAVASAQEDTLLYRYRGETLTTSKYGPIAAFQKALDAKLQTCTPAGPHVVADGSFGSGTQNAIIRLAQCHSFSKPLPASSPARSGAITSMIWNEVLPAESAPTSEQRANDLTLVFEATDYTALEFNYCQSRAPEKNGKTWLQGDPRCFSNDP